MRIKSILNILFIVFTVIYHKYGIGGKCIHSPESIRWGRVYFLFFYVYIVYDNIKDRPDCVLPIYKSINITAIIYFGSCVITEIICFIWTELYYVIISNTHKYLSGSLLALALVLYLFIRYKLIDEIKKRLTYKIK